MINNTDDDTSFIDVELRTDMNIVRNLLKDAIKEGLEVEVVTWALDSMKINSNQSISEAISHGYNEWIK